jgi:uncharacterized membrane protein YhaH (DUF805 family)
MDHLWMPLKRYADFSGRSRRREYWTWTLFVLLAEILLYGLIFGAARRSGGEMTPAVGALFTVLVIFLLAILIPSLALSVRRLHDQERSGLYVLLILVPLAGLLALLVLMALPGTPGPNRYGTDPKDGAFAKGGAGTAP